MLICWAISASFRVGPVKHAFINKARMILWSRGSSDNIVSEYGLTTGRSGFDPRQSQKNFSSSLCVQTFSGAHPVSYPMGIRGPFPGDKERSGRKVDHSLHLAPRSIMGKSYTIHVEFVVDKVAQGQIFLRVLRFSPVNIIPPSFSLLIYHPGNEHYVR
jgi:hypothetical protein